MTELLAGVVGVIGTNTGRGGTGFVIGPNRVLTARHVLAGSGQKGGLAEVFPYYPNDPNHMQAFKAKIAWRPDGDVPDAAILEVVPSETQPDLVPGRPIRYAACSSEQLLRARAHGFPRVGAKAVDFERLTNIIGEAQQLDFGASGAEAGVPIDIAFVSAVWMEDQPQRWQGLSGAALFCGNAIVGVMRNFPDAWDARRQLQVEPLSRLVLIPEFVALAGPAAQRALLVAQPTREAQYKPEFARLLPHTFMINRRPQSRSVAGGLRANRDRGPIELVVNGDPDDACDEFVRRVWREFLCPPVEDPPDKPLHLRSEPRRAVAWPDENATLSYAAALDDACFQLALDVASAQGRRVGLDADLAEEIGKLVVRDHPLWLPVILPHAKRSFNDFDREVLRRWRIGFRAAWDARTAKYPLLANKAPPPVGYMLIWAAETPPAGLLGTAQAEKCIQLHTQLSSLTVDELRQWIGELPDGGDAANITSGATKGEALRIIAQTVADELEWAGEYVVRLEEVIRLMRNAPMRPKTEAWQNFPVAPPRAEPRS